MKHIKNIIIINLTLLIMISIIIKRELIINVVGFSLNIWIKNLIPTLFPFMIISEILVNYNLCEYLGLIFNKITKKCFKVDKAASSVFFLSLLSGFPSNAKITRQLYDIGTLSAHQASKILSFTHFGNPFFILGTIGFMFLNNKTAGTVILISHILGNVIVGIILSNLYHEEPQSNNINYNIPKPLGTVLSKAIINTSNTLFLILGVLTIFLILSTLILEYLPLSAFNTTIIKGFLEITQGLQALSTLSLSLSSKTIIATMMISFGGLSVHIQVNSLISDSKISYIPYLCGRILHMVISGLISFILTLMLF